GRLAALQVLAALGESGESLAEMARHYERYVASGEINSTVADQAGRLAEIKRAYAGERLDELDGLTITFADGAWANIRPSNTEPLLRLNIEAPTVERMTEIRDSLLAIIRAS